MALRVYKYGEKVLRQKAAVIDIVSDKHRALVDEMLALMYETKGVGLAAPQVGISERFCVIDIPEGCEDEAAELFNAPISMPLKMFNPEIISREGTQCDKEGCLSFPGIGGVITRAYEVTCQYVDENNLPQIVTARGFLARAIQHEIDHLDGILYVDHMSAVERLKYAPKLKKLAKQNGGDR